MKHRFKTFIVSAFLLTSAVTVSAQQALPVYLDESKSVEQRIDDALSRMTLDEKIAVIHAQSKFSSRGIPRLGFPDFWTDDGPHGVRPDVLWDEWEQAGQTNDSCVAFPALTCLAASWNPQMAQLYGKSLGEEALYRGKDMILGPGVNIYRTPLGGRNFEYMGEDPFLTSTMVVPYIIGLQSNGVSACVKHFCLNNDEEYRHQVNVKISDRALHEIYLPAFKAAVQKGHVWALMGAYNLYKDEHNCHNEYLLKDLLKGKWGFDGVVVSDWGGTHNTDQAVHNGLDMEFGSWTNGLSEGASNAYDSYYLANPYKKGILSGKYSMDELNDKVRRVLRLYYRTTMAKRGHGLLCSESHYDAAKRIGEDGIVLLKNDGGVLPIDVDGLNRPIRPNGHNMPNKPNKPNKPKAQKTMTDHIITFTIRLIVAMILGGIVGLEREYRAKDAGFRTHFLVAIGSALFTLISMYGFADGVKDTSRVAAQVVSGIGFLGAGIIVFQRNVIRGLTTAAGLWVTAAIGMACGVGQFYMAVLVTLLILIGLEVLNRFIPHIGSSSVQLSFSSPSRKDVADAIMNIRKIVVDVISYEIKNKESDKGEYYKVQMEVRTKHRQRNDRILEILKDFDNVNIIDVE